MLKLPKNQNGIGAILLVVAVVLVIAVVVLAFFLFRGNSGSEGSQTSEQNQSSGSTISDDEVPLRICETGDPEQCNDPVSNEEVDNITNFEDEYP